MEAGFDLTELELFGNSLLDVADRQFPNETKTFLRKKGTELNQAAKKTAKERVGKNGKGKQEKTANKRYLNGFKRGKVYKHAASNSFAVRVYNSRPHAHLIEYGHVQLDHDKNPVKNGERFVRGFHVLRDAASIFEIKFSEDAEDFIDDLLDRGLGL